MINKTKIKEKLISCIKDKTFIINALVWLTISIILFKIGEGLNQSGGLSDFKAKFPSEYKLNLTLFLLFSSIGLIFKKSRILAIVMPLILSLFYIGNGILLNLRGTPLIWADILLIKEGLGMMSNYGIDKYILPALIGLAVLIVVLFLIHKTDKPKTKYKIFNPLGVIVVFLVFIAFHEQVATCKTEKQLELPIGTL